MKLTEKQRDWLHILKLWIGVNAFFPPNAMAMYYMDPYIHRCYSDALKNYHDALNAYKTKYSKK